MGIEKYRVVAQNAVTQIKSEPVGAKVTQPEKYIMPDLCEALEKTVMYMLPLAAFKKNHNLTRTTYILYLQYVLPQLFSEKTMHGFFLKHLIEGHNDPESWTPCSKRGDFQRITGLTYYFKDTYGVERGGAKGYRYHWILSAFTYTYEELYTVDLQYPQSLIAEVERCFKEKIPMPHTYAMFTDLYLGRRDVPYLKFVSQVLYIRYGENRVADYIRAVGARYAADFGTYKQGSLYLMDIVKYIFGQCFASTSFVLSTYKKRYKRINTPLLQFKSVIMKTLWPYVYAHYASTHAAAYEMMRLTEQEKAEYEERYFSTPAKKNYAAKARVISDPEAHYPNGSSYDEIRAAVSRYYATIVKPTREIPSREQAVKEIVRVTAPSSGVVKDLKYMHSHSSVRPHLASLMEDEENLLRAEYAETNVAEINSDKNVICIYFFHKGRYISRKIDFSVIKSEDFRREAKLFCRALLGKKISVSNIAKIKKAIQFMTDMISRYRIYRCRDVTKGYICIWLHKRQQAGIKPMTITEELCVVRSLMDAVMHAKGYEGRPDVNPALQIRFYGAHGHIEHRPVIPDDISVFITDHLWELDEETRLMYQILSQTCWRYDDAANLRVNGFYEIDTPEYAGIRTVISKTKKQRIKNAVGEYLEDVITRDLYCQLQSYIEGTAKIREKYATDYVFFSCAGGMAHQTEIGTFNAAVNGLLARHGIKSINESYTGFSSSQPRATGATALIEAGVSLQTIQLKLGQLSPETTAKHYAHVREKKLSEHDKEFYEKKFAELFDPEKLRLLTEKDRKALYNDFVIGKIQTEFGACIKQPCGGACRRHGGEACAECTKLLTGPQNLSAWQKYLDASDQRLSDLISVYATRGIKQDVYAEFEEYKEEARRNAAFRDVVKKIIEWKEGMHEEA